MSRAESLLEQLPAEITVDGEQYRLSITKNNNPDFPSLKYTAQYGRWSNTSEEYPEGFPADVVVTGKGPTDIYGRQETKWREYSISLGYTLEEALEDLLRRVKDYIKLEE